MSFECGVLIRQCVCLVFSNRPVRIDMRFLSAKTCDIICLARAPPLHLALFICVACSDVCVCCLILSFCSEDGHELPVVEGGGARGRFLSRLLLVRFVCLVV